VDATASKKLRVGTRVLFSDGVMGTVTENRLLGVKVDWDDGQLACIIHHDDMQGVSIATVAAVS
jgi:hypothetical protein